MVALEAAFSSSLVLRPNPSPSIRLHNSASIPTLSLKFPPHTLPILSVRKSPKFELCSAVQDIAVAEEEEEEQQQQQQPDPKTQQSNQKRKLFVINLPWSLSVDDFKNLFGECGTVSDVEIIKNNDGKNRGFAFVTMGSGEEAQAVIDKFDSTELLGRIIRVEFAKRFKKPSRPPALPVSVPAGETRHKLYVSNLAWKVRSTHLREVFAANFNPVSVRVVFDSPSGRSAGYGFVSFATKEEAVAAISALDGKELLGRPIRLKFSEKTVEESSTDRNEEENISVEAEQS